MQFYKCSGESHDFQRWRKKVISVSLASLLMRLDIDFAAVSKTVMINTHPRGTSFLRLSETPGGGGAERFLCSGILPL